MGKLLQGILGGISGSVGNVVGSSWKGIPVIKSKPLSVANPRTAGQVIQRSKMTNVVEFAKPILSTTIKPLWDRFAQQQSGYNAFIKRNISLFQSPIPSPLSDLAISTGKMAASDITSFTFPEGTRLLSVTWRPDVGEGLKLHNDEAYVVVLNVTKNDVKGYANIGSRGSGGASEIPVPSNWDAEDEFHIWLAFRREDGTVVSETSYSPLTT